MRASVRLSVLAALVVAASCGGGKTADSAASAAPAVAAVDPATLNPTSITPQQVAHGDSLFHGLIGAISCQACHGPDAKGGVVAPDLTDTTWLHSDGSYGAIYHQIEIGVSAPKQYSSVMPPFGGFPMTPEQHLDVAAYVYSLSHKLAK